MYTYIHTANSFRLRIKGAHYIIRISVCGSLPGRPSEALPPPRRRGRAPWPPVIMAINNNSY